jgi:hypothetical protein
LLYVYGFVAPPARLPDVRGIGDAELRAESLDGLEAIVSEHETTVDPSEAAVLAHARVVDAIGQANDGVLPARFGGVHTDAATLRSSLAGRADLHTALDRVRGRVELAVRVLGDPDEPARRASGAEYMRTRLEQRHRSEERADAVHAPLAALASAATSTVGATPRLLLSSAYLVERGRVDEFRREVAALQSRHPELGIVCTGPWPPYSFATAEREAS